MTRDPRGEVTCWTVIRGAVSGDEADRSLFCQQYLPVVRSYLTARWARMPLEQHVEDAVQEVFLECFREQGVLASADSDRSGGFRAFLFGVVRNVAMRVERASARRHARQTPADVDPDEVPSGEDGLSTVFDRAWARALVRQAVELQERRANDADDATRRRVELLQLRFVDGLPIRDIAAKWGEDPAAVQLAYRKARKEFRDCLRQVVSFHNPGAAGQTDGECVRLLSLLE